MPDQEKDFLEREILINLSCGDCLRISIAMGKNLIDWQKQNRKI